MRITTATGNLRCTTKLTPELRSLATQHQEIGGCRGDSFRKSSRGLRNGAKKDRRRCLLRRRRRKEERTRCQQEPAPAGNLDTTGGQAKGIEINLSFHKGQE